MNLTELKEKYLADGKIDDAEVEEWRETVFEDGRVDIDELTVTTELQNAVSGADNSEGWRELYADILCSYALGDDESPDEVDESEAKTIIELLGDVDHVELYALAQLCARGDKVHQSLIDHTSSAILSCVTEDGIIDDNEVDIIEAFIYGKGGEKVTWDEATLVQKLNDATDAKLSECSEKWKPFYVRVMKDVVLSDDETPGVVSDDEAQKLVDLIKDDGKYNDCELAAMSEIKAEATEISDILLTELEVNQI